MPWLRELIELAVREQRAHNQRQENALATAIHEIHVLKGIAMSNQEQLNALTDKVTNMQGDITTLGTTTATLITTTNDLTAEVKKLIDANPDLDFSAVNDAVDAADQAVRDAKAAVDTANTNNPDPGPQGG